ncbi:MAG: lytic murein transglycosylase [Candidatus Marinimicrobia bacterium]|nr:lytic murein transglycosylase [Candidatus Neomarinimicrobiota bacterium]MCF7903726.1 lytic murein transglycosylase [Candidatus Neomarinimicrobiota bacterium]
MDLVNRISSNDDARNVYTRVVKRLRRSGVPVSYAWEVFSDPEIRVDETIVKRFSKPAERLDYSDYRRIFVNNDRINEGILFYYRHQELLNEVADRYGVDPFLILSFVGVETRYGRHSSSYPVFNSLHTIIHTMPRRAKWVEDEMVAWFMICRVDGLNPLGVMGSYAGAFGYGQFMPTSFKHYAVDVDGDGVREPYEWADVFGSIANYLLKRGRYNTASMDFTENSRNWRAVYKYNPSKNYVKAVLELRSELRQAIN